MKTSEVGPIAAELYNVVAYVYWTDDANTKKTIVYRPEHEDQTFDGGFVSIFAADKIMI